MTASFAVEKNVFHHARFVNGIKTVRRPDRQNNSRFHHARFVNGIKTQQMGFLLVRRAGFTTPGS